MLRALVLSFVREVVLLAAPFYMQMTVDEVIARGDLDLLTVLARLCAVGRRAPENLARRGLPISKGCPARSLLQAICPCRRARFVGSIAIMLTPVICPSCHHTGAIDGARLPRTLTCVCCGHSELFEAPPPNWLTREQRASERARRRAYETGELVRSLLST